MLRKIVLALVALVVLAVAFVASRPDHFEVQRSANIEAPPAAVHALVNDFRSWSGWSPWEKLDPSMKKTYSGSGSGTGAVYEWSGNESVGEGRMTIVESVPPERVSIRLEFLKPVPSTADTRFEIAPRGAGSTVTWSMVGHNDFLGKLAGLFIDFESMIGRSYEEGLAALGRIAEGGASPGAATAP